MLQSLPDAEADAAGDDGYLRGNSRYEDHRGWTVRDVAAALAVETRVVESLANAADCGDAEAAFEAERDPEADGPDGLWGLDVGVASAVIALSALGATPFISCNAGFFGGAHPASRPYVAFYLANADPTLLKKVAEEADVGLETEDGVLRLYARSVFDLLEFARRVLEAKQTDYFR